MPTFRFVSVCLVLAAFFSAPTWSADLVITNGQVFTAVGNEGLRQSDVTVSAGKIERVAPGARPASGATVIDARGKTVLPGLINGHLHLFFDFYKARSFPKSDAEARAYIGDRVSRQLADQLQHGFTSLLSPIDFWPFITDVRDRVKNGSLPGPRLFIAGPVLMAPGDHYICSGIAGAERQWCNDHIAIPVARADQARSAVGSLAARGVDVIMYDGLTNSRPSKEVIAAIADEAHKRGLRVLVHNSNAQDVNMLIEAGVDGFVHPPGVTRDVDGSLLRQAGARHIPLAVTLGGAEESIREGTASDAARKNYELVHHNVSSLIKFGAVPILASDMPGIPGQEVMRVAGKSLAGVGLDNAQILRAATRDAAQKLLGKPDLGTLEAGQIADIIVVDGNPLDDLGVLSRIEVVIKDGKIVFDARR